MEDVASMFTAAERLFGVKTTSKRLAVNSEFSWHAASELDRSTCSALAGAKKAARLERSNGLIDGSRILDQRGQRAAATVEMSRSDFN